MMKYIKLFEAHSPACAKDCEYWRIDCKSISHILLSLKKIGLTPADQIYQNIKSSYDNLYQVLKISHFYIRRSISIMNEIFWDYTLDLQRYKGQYKYNGIVKVKDWEVDAEKYNL